jgi:hypothetical protein
MRTGLTHYNNEVLIQYLPLKIVCHCGATRNPLLVVTARALF